METQTNSTRSKLNAGYFFLCLGVLISLITSVVSFLHLVFETLNKRFPDVLNSSYQYGYSSYEYESIRNSLASLIIFFPVFLIISYFWNKFGNKVLGSIDEIIKKWVIYIILFISSLVAIIDLVTLVRYFISGEITSRFIYKVLTTLIVAILVGTYYIYLLRGKDNPTSSKVGIIIASIGAIFVIVSIFYSFSIMGSPAKQRLLRLDDRRVTDLQNIQYQVINFWQQKEQLPKDLNELVNPTAGTSLPVPPLFEKGELYEYKTTSPLSFELCATFDLPIPSGWKEYGGKPSPYVGFEGRDVASTYPAPFGGVNESWSHEAGRTCFARTIDKDIYPPYKKQ